MSYATGMLHHMPPGHWSSSDAGSDWARFAVDRRDADSLATEWAALHRDLRRDGPTGPLFDRRDAWRKARASFREGAAVPP